MGLSWANEDDRNVDYYDIQRSNNGVQFQSIGKIASNQSGNYSYNDKSFIAGSALYYRIKAVSADGTVNYTNILFLKANQGRQEMQVSPNPSKGKAFSVSLTNFTAGKYTLKIMDLSGKTVYTESIIVGDERNIIQTIILPTSVSRGLHYLLLEGDAVMINKRVLVD